MACLSSAVVVAFVGLVGFAHSAAAQGIGQGFVYGGPIAPLSTAAKPSAALTFGAGLEALTRSGAGASLEGGVFGLDGLWVPQLSANAIYEKTKASGVSPFITGGVTLSGPAINFGGGANIWTHDRIALRIEIRDYMQPAAPALQTIAFRVGMTFR
jgi:hypothetical protein